MPLIAPPTLQAPAPLNPAQKAQLALLEAYDWGRPFPAPPKLAGVAALSDQWLRTALAFAPLGPAPRNPFPGGASQREVQLLLTLLRHPDRLSPQVLQRLRLHEAGTALVLWRWGQAQVRRGAWRVPQRRAWEDRLLTAGPPLSRGYALRHALCFALAEQDEARFTQLRALADPAAERTLVGFQRLFGLLGGPLPEVRLWSLPELAYQDRLPATARRLWIRPLDEGPVPPLPPATAWILPSLQGALDERSATLDAASRQEGEVLAQRLRLSLPSGRAWFAPSRSALESLGLAWFPILLELDTRGTVTRIQMGDAAPEQP